MNRGCGGLTRPSKSEPPRRTASVSAPAGRGTDRPEIFCKERSGWNAGPVAPASGHAGELVPTFPAVLSRIFHLGNRPDLRIRASLRRLWNGAAYHEEGQMRQRMRVTALVVAAFAAVLVSGACGDTVTDPVERPGIAPPRMHSGENHAPSAVMRSEEAHV